jgi:hypothetical protein
VRRATRLSVLEDASTHDVASRGTATERMNDFGAKMIGMVWQRLSASDARDCQGPGDGYEQRKTTNEIDPFSKGGGALRDARTPPWRGLLRAAASLPGEWTGCSSQGLRTAHPRPKLRRLHHSVTPLTAPINHARSRAHAELRA